MFFYYASLRLYQFSAGDLAFFLASVTITIIFCNIYVTVFCVWLQESWFSLNNKTFIYCETLWRSKLEAFTLQLWSISSLSLLKALNCHIISVLLSVYTKSSTNGFIYALLQANDARCLSGELICIEIFRKYADL